jgi:hypothetical protein
MPKRTPEEIAEMIAALEEDRRVLPEFSRFGDPNWKIIDAELAVLRTGKHAAPDIGVDGAAEVDLLIEWLEGNISWSEFWK